MIHHTRPAHAVISPSGWLKLDAAWDVLALPLWDMNEHLEDGTPLFARLNYDEALEVAAREGAQLPQPEHLEQLRRVGVQLQPYLGTPVAENAIEHSRRHDGDVWRQLRALAWDGSRPVAGAGKHWIAGAPAGKSRLMGWDKDGAGPGTAWWQPASVAHNRQHFDDGTTTLLVRPALHDTDPAPRPGASWADAILGPLRTVGGWLTDAIATDGAQVVELPPHGWRCSVAELVADARALSTWRPAGSGYVPRVGDLCISARAGGDPTTGGTGHVERVVVEHHRYPETIGGNEGDTWRRAADLDLLGPSYRGAIEYPHALGLRAVDVTLAEAAAGIRERPGPLAHPRIQAYHAGARRGGSARAGMPGHEREGSAVLGATASDEIAWCASGASSCCYEAAAP